MPLLLDQARRTKKKGIAGEKKAIPAPKKRITAPQKHGYDPLPKEEHQRKVRTLLTMLGMTVPAGMLAGLLWKTAQDVLRDHQTQLLVEADVSTSKDWNIEDETACEFCQEAAAASPYDNADEGPITHPNCRCYWTPHID